ncbi:CG14329 [Drosophila busckii]|uniref:CG14329 n=1 Tax=Drosophila busckii TaxID=30019 RepID=A0A0M4ED85_DROBS|nr:uncharacterized protein LOC108601302 [Drosophila busckii]ALC45716.1 CG14329 [Drosophila busckii]
MQLYCLLLLGLLGCAAAAPRGYYYDDYNYARRRAAPVSNYNRYSRDSSKATDNYNAKFAGASNQELDDLNADVGDSKTLLLKKKLKKKLIRQQAAAAAYGHNRPCLPYGRAANGQQDAVEQGRFLFDLNVYNVYPGAGGCRGYGGGLGGLGGYGAGLGGLGGGLLSDPVAPVAPVIPVRPYAPFATWLSLFAPGILQNSLAATVPAVPLADPLAVRPASAAADDLQSDPAVDPQYNPQPVRRPVPNRVYYDSAGAPPVTPAQLVGGVATTVNGIIQQLTGQVQPVYQTGAYRSRNHRSSYG